MTVPIESLLVVHVSVPGVEPRICHRFRDISSQNFDFSSFDLDRANPEPKVTKMGDDVPSTLVYHTQKTSARSRKLCTKYVLPKFFTFWPLGG